VKVIHLSLVTLTALASLTCAPIAQARELSITGPNGRTTIVNTNRQRKDNGSMVQRSFTLPNGRVYNQAVDYTRTGNGGYNRNVLWTDPQGRQTTVQGTGTYQNGVLNGTRTVTYPNGQPRTSTYQSRP
jgi:antitoxin component YwqK of YwqJK toxin-antitoxin module